jgi:L-aminopeptidase/D-esterase-like protein
MDKGERLVRPAPMAPSIPGPLNLITDVPGLKVGQSDDAKARTGVTVILPDAPSVAAVDVRGGGPGTRETDALAPEALVDAVDAVVIAGGSVYGLAAADGVAAWLGAQGRGFGLATAPGVPRSPIVPAAILYDLANGGDKDWGLEPPYRDLGITAAQAAEKEFSLGSAGAGAGAMAGRLKGGLGSASIVTAEGYTLGALAAVNSFGSVIAPGGKAFWAAPHEIGEEFGAVPFGNPRAGPDDWAMAKRDPASRSNTTLVVVALDVILTPAEAKRLAIMAQDGVARAIRPAHAPFDGDVVFVLSTGRIPLAEPKAASLSRLGALAADCVARAIARGVFAASAWPGSDTLAWRDLA